MYVALQPPQMTSIAQKVRKSRQVISAPGIRSVCEIGKTFIFFSA